MKALLQDSTQAQLRAIAGSRSGSYIFHGAKSTGKATAAAELARQLNCQGDESGPCSTCRQFESGNYPDYLVIRPEDKPSIVIEQIRSLIQTLSLSSYYHTGARVIVIDDAWAMTLEAQNALLKLIEEPPPQTTFLLVTHRLTALLPTVRSRCATIFFPPLAGGTIAEYLTTTHGIPGPLAAEAAVAAGGATGQAVVLATRPTEAAALQQIAQTALSIPKMNLFDRFILAAQLITAKADLIGLGYILHANLVKELRSGTLEVAAAAQSLAALEHFRLHLGSKVVPKVSLERLMLDF